MDTQVLPPDPNRAIEYQRSNYLPLKFLLPDGSVITATGEIVLPADVSRALQYGVFNYVPLKFLLPDGSVVFAISGDGSSSSYNLDGGEPDSIYGGSDPIDGGGV